MSTKLLYVLRRESVEQLLCRLHSYLRSTGRVHISYLKSLSLLQDCTIDSLKRHGPPTSDNVRGMPKEGQIPKRSTRQTVKAMIRTLWLRNPYRSRSTWASVGQGIGARLLLGQVHGDQGPISYNAPQTGSQWIIPGSVILTLRPCDRF